MTINVFRLNRLPATCRKAELFRAACRAALGAKAKGSGELNLVFLSNPETLKMNRKFLGHDYNTDVIAFPYSADEAPTKSFYGDVFVSYDQARIQARDIGHSHLRELLTLAIHGTLHLIGYDDHATADRERMFARQDRILTQLDFESAISGRIRTASRRLPRTARTQR